MFEGMGDESRVKKLGKGEDICSLEHIQGMQPAISTDLDDEIPTDFFGIDCRRSSGDDPHAKFTQRMKISTAYEPSACATAFRGDCMDLLRSIPSKTASLVVTSPPYNIGKEYEKSVRFGLILTGKRVPSRSVTDVLQTMGPFFCKSHTGFSVTE